MLKSITLFIVMLLTVSFFSVNSYSQTKKKDYTVKKGDILWNIAMKTLKKHTLWPAIWEANKTGIVNKDKFQELEKKSISNPNLIYPKQILTIPNVKTIDPLALKKASDSAKELRKKLRKTKK